MPIGYTAFAFALGVTAGTVVRRTVPAMALTLVVFVAVQIAAPTVRAQLGPSEHTTTITADNLRGLGITGLDPSGKPEGVRFINVAVNSPGSWVVTNETVDRSGNVVGTSPRGSPSACPAGAPRLIRRDATCYERLASEGYRQHLAYMPASRYWTLQAYRDGGLPRARRRIARRHLLVDSPPRVVATSTVGPMRKPSPSALASHEALAGTARAATTTRGTG